MWEAIMKARAMNADFKMETIEVGHKMKQEGLPSLFITAAVETAFEFHGVYNLMKMWAEETDQEVKDETIAEIQNLIDDCSQKDKIEGAHIRFDDLDGIAKHIRAFKDNLRMIVDQNGGVGTLSDLTGIPQPSLSRLFSSASMPRRTTLLKIAKALKLSQVQITTEWAR